jgi:hypothetical protein
MHVSLNLSAYIRTTRRAFSVGNGSLNGCSKQWCGARRTKRKGPLPPFRWIGETRALHCATWLKEPGRRSTYAAIDPVSRRGHGARSRFLMDWTSDRWQLGGSTERRVGHTGRKHYPLISSGTVAPNQRDYRIGQVQFFLLTYIYSHKA